MKHKDLLEAMAANERAELYFAAHPGSPAAVRRPQLWIRSGTWVAVLGRSIQEGIVGIGATVETALRAFDHQYLAALRPPGEHRVDSVMFGTEAGRRSSARRRRAGEQPNSHRSAGIGTPELDVTG
jgi:hypothetical protein